MKKLLIIIVIGIVFESCKKDEDGQCLSDSGKVTFWMNSETASKVGYEVEMAYFVNNELVGTGSSQGVLSPFFLLYLIQ